jgi:hypothetical protein
MPALAAGIHVLLCCISKDVDARHKAGHDEKTKCAGQALDRVFSASEDRARA